MKRKAEPPRKYHASYEPPPAPFKPGQKVYYYDLSFEVIHSTHTHTQLDGVEFAVPNWQLATRRKRSVIS
jgi:hypothetical protein